MVENPVQIDPVNQTNLTPCSNKVAPSIQNKNDPIEMYVKIDFYVIS